MNKYLIVILFSILSLSLSAQVGVARTINPEFEEKIDSYLSYSIPTITVDELLPMQGDVVLLDAREKEEYVVSHIPNAEHVGYDHINMELLKTMDKTKPVVVYCSIGYRSEKIAEQLKKEGFTKVYNLYGSIFEWVNRGQSICDMQGSTTNKIHTYNKSWSKWVENKNFEKVW